MYKMHGISKRLAAILLALFLLTIFAACGSEDPKPTEAPTETPTAGGTEQGTDEAPGDENVDKETTIKNSTGLAYANTAYGTTCYLQGLGTCTDTKVVIPAINEAGNTVIGINAEAFSGAEAAKITEINIPDTVKTIAADTFDGCTGLKTIRYFGSEGFWNEMMASGGVDALPADVEVIFSKYCDLTIEYLFIDKTPAASKKVITYISNDEYTVQLPSIKGYRADAENATGVIAEDMTVTVIYTRILAEGTCGEKLTWVLYEDGEMRISGTGVMSDFVAGTAPWTPFVDKISLVTFADTVEGVGAYAFADCTSIDRIELPAGLKAVGANAFRGWTEKQTVLFRGGVDILVLADAVWQGGANAQISFLHGKYEQDADLENGMEPIEWTLVEQDRGSYLLTTVYALEMMPYHDSPVSVTWEKSSLRKWIKDSFISTAFSAEEKAVHTFMKKGIGTQDDTVFVLGASDLAELFEEEYLRIRQATAAANPTEVENEDGTTSIVPTDEAIYWWLRDQGDLGELAQNVSPEGVVNTAGALVTAENRGVLLAVWVEPTAPDAE